MCADVRVTDGWGHEVEVMGKVRLGPKDSIKALGEEGKAKMEKLKGEKGGVKGEE